MWSSHSFIYHSISILQYKRYVKQDLNVGYLQSSGPEVTRLPVKSGGFVSVLSVYTFSTKPGCLNYARRREGIKRLICSCVAWAIHCVL